MAELVPVAKLDDLKEGVGREVIANEKVLALFRIGDKVFALDGVCPHAGGPLAEGSIQGEIVTCPWHGWQFEIPSGRHCLSSSICADSYSVVIQDGQILVEM